MIYVKRPNVPPAGFSKLAAEELEKAKSHFKAKDAGRFEFSAYKSDVVRLALEKLFHGKCAYCESKYIATQPMDVEHFRPKSKVLTPAGRKRGYWWLAAAWSNLLPSCIDCNRVRKHVTVEGQKISSGKGCKFPLRDETKRAAAEGDECHEEPLLLDPCRVDPIDHIDFVVRNGVSVSVTIGSDGRGRTSIDVYGLNRKGLADERLEVVLEVERTLRRIEDHLLDLSECVPGEKRAARYLDRLREDLKLIGGYTSPTQHYTAASRALVRRKCDLLKRAADTIAAFEPPLPAATPAQSVEAGAQ